MYGDLLMGGCTDDESREKLMKIIKNFLLPCRVELILTSACSCYMGWLLNFVSTMHLQATCLAVPFQIMN